MQTGVKRVFFIAGFTLCVAGAYAADGLRLWYSKPAKEWVEALPLGNSRIGAMVYGGTLSAEYQFNEETLWGGGPHRNDNPDALQALPEVRRLIFSGRTNEAQDLVNKTFRTPRNGMPYQTAGSLLLHFPGHEDVTEYSRELDLEKALTTTQYKVRGVTFTRTVFTSFVDQVMIIRIAADKPSSLSFAASYKSPLDHEVKKKGKKLVLTGRGKEHEGVEGAIRMETQTEIRNTGGKVAAKGDKIFVTGADSVTIYVSVATNFKNYKEVSEDESRKASALLLQAMKKTYDKALSEHVAYYRQQFDRVRMDLGTSQEAEAETDVRIRNFGNGKDPSLAVLLFQYGRYLLISSSQPGGQPANLQGIWNDKLLAPWDGKYTVNINLQMNYWPSDVTNLKETFSPLVQMLKELSVSGRETARTMYNCRGWGCITIRICGVLRVLSMVPSGGCGPAGAPGCASICGSIICIAGTGSFWKKCIRS